MTFLTQFNPNKTCDGCKINCNINQRAVTVAKSAKGDKTHGYSKTCWRSMNRDLMNRSDTKCIYFRTSLKGCTTNTCKTLKKILNVTCKMSATNPLAPQFT